MLVQVKAVLKNEGYYVDVDATSKTLNKKIRENQLAQYNYILVVGAEEIQNKTVNVRTRDNTVHGSKSIPQLLQELHDEVVQFH